MQLIEEKSIVIAWKKAKELIIREGAEVLDDNEVLLELLDLFLIIHQPERSDQETEVQDIEIKKWMLSNFKDIKYIPELHDTKSYGWRLYNYNGKNQIDWIVNKLKRKQMTKSATIITIQPEDEKYIPCVSLLDFKIRNNALILSATCRSLDFGKKALYNMYALSDILHDIAKELQINNKVLKLLVISAHVYKKDL